MNSSTQAQTEQNQPKTINDLYQAFASLADSYNQAYESVTSSNLAILQADCALLAGVAQALKANANTAHLQDKAGVQTGQYQTKTPNRTSLSEIITKQNQDRGLVPMPLEVDLLLKRVADGGHSGQYLADAFISAHRIGKPFNHSLGEVVQLDCEAFRLLHEILHIRHVPKWNDDDLYHVEQQVIAIVGGAA
jgi:hypothetical protein